MQNRYESSGGAFTAKHRSTTYDFISPLQFDLSGKHVLVTGTAWESGVGFATATAFARAGASIIAVVDLHPVPADLISKLKSVALATGRPEPTVLTSGVDIAKPESVQAMYESLSQGLKGRLDILVNNAAHMEPYESFLDSDPEVFWRTWEVNIHGLINMARIFLPLQLASHASAGGLCTMINLASSGALSVRPGSSAYRTSKLAVLRWTEALQTEYADQGLLAYCVNPGAIKTEITKTAPDSVRNRFPDQPDVAGDTIVWLGADRKEWLGGRYISCVWDMEEVMQKKDEIVSEDKLKLKMTF
ncbi:hypothetical protein FSARC_11539 [Fusarium sarcochroum]|uniref:NAD(P)-binding protein n=1 Tax=Fusarium sarcochroum TaxID=1208366 RepID=A0A8H4WZR9_9HYPO|nr:hypothetical protein FSARC_11539 [Fusarium sarcochroum]